MSALVAAPVLAQAQGTAGVDQAQTPAPPTNDPVANASVTPASPDTATAKDAAEIVVTGTLLRGVAPTGTNIIAVNQADLQVNAIHNTSQIMEDLPQFVNFNQLQMPSASGPTVTSNKPTLRGLPGNTTAGGSTTLMLVNGHRTVGIGVNSTVPDVDIVPGEAIERLEIVPDGGSAIYGSDAVAGTMNFITRKTYDGFEASARYGFANAYHIINGDASTGKKWSTGSAYITYNFSENDGFFGRDRGYIKQQPSDVSGIPFPVTSLQCSPGNIQNVSASGTVYALPFAGGVGVPNTANQCDPTDDVQQYASSTRHNVMIGAQQELSDSVKIDLDGYYIHRVQHSATGEFRATSLISPTGTSSPFEAQYSNAGTIQNVSYEWGPPDSNYNLIKMQSWELTPGVTVKLGGDWQFRGILNYGWSHTRVDQRVINTAALTNSIKAGLFNPYDPASSSPDALAAIANWDNFGQSTQQLANARGVIDGSLFRLPGGPVKLAVGVEYIYERLKVQKGLVVPGTEDSGYGGLSLTANLPGSPTRLIVPAAPGRPVFDLDRNTKAVFAELNVPIFGPDNEIPFFHALSLSASGRYDRYSDFGGTFNPKFGATYKPVRWISLRGSWGRSFNAPSLVDSQGANPVLATVGDTSTAANVPPISLQQPQGTYPKPQPGQQVIVLTGSVPVIKPQKAKSLSIGGDIDVPFIPGLTLSSTYYKLSFTGQIGVPPISLPATFWTNFTQLITLNPSPAQIAAATAGVQVTGNAAPCQVAGCAYAILDERKQNLGDYLQDGFDFGMHYSHPTNFGAVNASFNGNYVLDSIQSRFSGGPKNVDLIKGNKARFLYSVGAGTTVGNFTAQAQLHHQDPYDLLVPVGTITEPQQTHIKAFNSLNLLFGYDFNGDGLTKGLSLTLNVTNALNANPPFEKSGVGYATSTQTLGRYIEFGIRKKF